MVAVYIANYISGLSYGYVLIWKISGSTFIVQLL